MLLCFVLTVVVVVASLICVQRLELEDRAEAVIAASIVWNSLIVVPIYALGLTGLLTRGSVVAAALVSAFVVTAAACRRRAVRDVALGAWRLLVGIFRMPLDALTLTWRERSPVFVGVSFALVFLIWTAFTVYLAPSYRHWDALWYHEPMTGFTIQNRGFAPLTDYGLPPKINGYPRMCQMTQLWFGLLSDRRLIELPNVLFGPALICATYKLSLRFSRTTTLAVGWGAALLAMPANAHLMQTTLVDPHTSALVLASAHFTLRRPLAKPHVVLASLALGLAVGGKVLTLVPVGVLLSILCVRVLRSSAIGWRGVAALACCLPAVAMGLFTYVRNWINFNNPFWPDLKVNVPALGIDWPGEFSWQPTDDNYRTGLNINLPPGEFLEYLFARPWSMDRWHFARIFEYGAGVAWVLLPLGLVALLLAIPFRIADQWKAPAGSRVRAASTDACLIAVLIAAILLTSPALWAPRYHIATVGLLSALFSWLCFRVRAQRLELAAQFTVQVTAIMHLFWEPQREWVDFKTASALLSVPYPEREVRPELGAPVTREFGLAREQRLGPGDVVVVTDLYDYPALFWNNAYSNQVRYLKNGPNFLARADALRATWVCCSEGSCLSEVKAAPDWIEIGPVHPGRSAKAFRRLTTSEAESHRALPKSR
jgi:hypothetical protein